MRHIVAMSLHLSNLITPMIIIIIIIVTLMLVTTTQQEHSSSLRKRLDSLRELIRRREREVQAKSDELKDLEIESESTRAQTYSLSAKENEDAQMKQIRILENRLDKALLKYNEAQSIRKTYEQIVRRLKEERLTFDTQLAGVESTLKTKEQELKDLILMSHDAQHAKEVWSSRLCFLFRDNTSCLWKT